MTKEYRFALLSYREDNGDVLCAKCGRVMDDWTLARRVEQGRRKLWCCERCAGDKCTGTELVGTIREAILL